MRHLDDDQRRARLGRRHALAPSCRVADVEAATRAMTVLHATEPASVHLAARARTPDLRVADVDRALYEDRTLVKQLAMRRTLFVFPRDLLAAARGSASARVAGPHGVRLATDVELSGIADDGARWLDEQREAVLERLARPDAAEGLTTARLRAEVPELDRRLDLAPDTKWGRPVPAAGRTITQLGVEGHLLRGRNDGGWWVSRPFWTLAERWLGEVPEATDAPAGYRELVARWLRTFGPGTLDDVVWWLGATKGAVRAALADLGAVEVTVDGPEGPLPAWVLPDDLDDDPEPEPWVALLPTLDPTVMGWKGRGFYLGAHGPDLFDRVGNAGTTCWVDGRVVGCWIQDEVARVHIELLEDVPADRLRALEEEAERVTSFVEGRRITSAWVSPAMKRAAQRRAESGGAR